MKNSFFISRDNFGIFSSGNCVFQRDYLQNVHVLSRDSVGHAGISLVMFIAIVFLYGRMWAIFAGKTIFTDHIPLFLLVYTIYANSQANRILNVLNLIFSIPVG